MSRRLFLPLADTAASRPTVDLVRKRLGGRSSTEPGAGEIVTLPNGRTGVVLFVRGDQLDVWLEGDVVRRVRRDEARAADGMIPREIYAVASDARAFAELREGQRVSFEQEGALRDGVLVEKCRFGALIEATAASGAGGEATSVIVGAGFRRVLALSPLP